ncbi:alpha/beta hydrolase [Variovorax sp. LG9.2]|uniref:alpha/beta hydrolase n=1 Tax=Variovorax sp. LG9.2 TaxID=3048626 RepID=UPI002B2236BA|nr:alpha/beta hydrolase [Variovorax sp. LG9.2]MEB0057107.1 alpha/beta hydrolase [Variovorax sp. LG9.2]
MPSFVHGRRGLRLAALAAAVALASLLASGCTGLRPAKAPIDTFVDKSTCTARADTLLIMLPGAYSHPDEFVRENFVSAVRERQLAVDIVRVDAHLGYYNKGAVIERLQQDVIAPARARGYKAIWIVGISIGGLGGLIYANAHPVDVTGLVVLAPYLGDRVQSLDVANAGGLVRWQGPLTDPVGDDRAGGERAQRETALWQWLKAYARRPLPVDHPPLYLGYGLDDRFAFSHRLLAAALPPERVFTTAGGHDWPEWTRLWRAVLPTLPLPGCNG